jgi:type II secretory ATPase GspE/PulE/Tfp pilus assembly ATPase PilB-like protein
VALFETLWIDKKLSSLISENVGEATLKENSNGYNSLSDDGIRKVMQGITTIDELKKLAIIDQEQPLIDSALEST